MGPIPALDDCLVTTTDPSTHDFGFALLAAAGSCDRRALGMRPRWRRSAVKAEPVEELRKQASIAVRVLKVFRDAALLLDEVRRRLRVTDC